MFRDKFQKGYLSILYSCGASPLELWDMHVENGYIRRVTDAEINSLALEIAGTNVSTTYIYTPKDTSTVLGIGLPFLIMVLKNMKKYFTFEITILDDKRMHRRFRVSNFQSATKIRPFSTSIPIGMTGGWNQIQFNLADFVKRAYGSNYIETTRMQIHANCRIRRIYFADRLYNENELPEEYKLFWPPRKCVRESDKKKKNDKTGSGNSSNASRAGSTSSQKDATINKTELPTAAPTTPLASPEEPPRLQIHVPTAQYEEEQEENSTERDSEIDDEVAKYKISHDSYEELPVQKDEEQEEDVYEYVEENLF